MAIPESHKPYLIEMRGLDRDSLGRDVLRGLTYEETEEYFAYLDNRLQDRDTSGDSTRYLDLHGKYEHARHEFLLIEMAAKRSGPKH